MVRAVLAGTAASLALASPAWAGWHEDAALARQGLDRATVRGWVTPDQAATYREDLAHADTTRRRVDWTRRSNLAGVLHDVAAQWRSYKPPRAFTLFWMLDFNATYLASNPMPPAGSDARDEDGITYRAVAGHGLQFHPLANFARLNALLNQGRQSDAEILAAALLDRAVQIGPALNWEYYFPYGGAAPWTSGMVEAVAAKTLAATGNVIEAHEAYLGMRSLLRYLPAGPWVRLYSFSSDAVLNAQLQAVLSLLFYADIAQSEAARTLANRMLEAADRLFLRFDTGAWSLYSLGGAESPLSYHRYVTLLLRKLALATGDQVWAQRADRFDAYRTQAPEVRLTVRPGRIAVWVSKLSTVSVRIGGWSTALTLSRGSTPVSVPVSPGRWAIVTATDVCGNKAVVRRRIP
jgi:hypothetical protein